MRGYRYGTSNIENSNRCRDLSGSKKVLDSIGISVEEAAVLFLKEVVARKGLPFPVSENELRELRHIRTERDI